MMRRAIGIDLSEWDLFPLDWKRARELLSFAFIKISQGTNPDPLFRAQWMAAEGYVLRGLYHMLDPYDNVEASVDKTIAIYKTVSPGELPPALDLELGAAPIELPRAKRWLERWEEKTGIHPIIYTSLGFLDNEREKPANQWLSKYRMWLSSWPYDNMSDEERKIRIGRILRGEILIPYPGALRPWPASPDFHQWTSRGEPGDIPGYYMGRGHKKAVDLNYYMGTQDDLFLKYGSPSKPPENGEVMSYRYSITPTSGIGSKVRLDHYVIELPSPNRIGSLAFGRFAFGNEKWVSPAGASEAEALEVWLHVLSVDGEPLEGWIAAKHQGNRFGTIAEIGTGEEEDPETPAGSIDISVKVGAEATAAGLAVNIDIDSPGFEPGSVSITLPRE